MNQKTDTSKMQFSPCKIEIVSFEEQDIIVTSGDYNTNGLYGEDWNELGE